VDRAASAQKQSEAKNQGERPVLHLLLPVVSVQKLRLGASGKARPHAPLGMKTGQSGEPTGDPGSDEFLRNGNILSCRFMRAIYAIVLLYRSRSEFNPSSKFGQI
jgi:hypothetical protein